MTVAAPRRPTLAERRARGAVAVLFFTNGALFANLLPRFPRIKADLGLGNTAYGLAVVAFPVGAIAAGLAAGTAVRLLRSARVAVLGTLLTGAGILGAGLAGSVWVLVAMLFLAGAADALVDVAQNAHGLRVQRRYGRPIINSLHALWSGGAVIGGSMAAAAIALELSRGQHLTISGVVFALAACLAWRFCLPGPDDESESDSGTGSDRVERAERAAPGARVVFVLTALVVIAMAGILVEDAGNSWATLYLSDSLHAPAALAAQGYVALVAAQFVGRLVGDRMVGRFGQRTVARSGGLITAVGMGLALAVPTVPGTVLGFAAAGFGVATLVPTAMHEADELPGLKPGAGLTVVSWLMRLGFLLSPPLVGLVADAAGLRVGLLVVPVAGVLVLLFSGVLSDRRA
ncbi:MFS transporter [Actinopolyspora erythraea]|uniref:Fucose permease n=1 Tax=Actinopolyspora erythraea TaxID=414996 RepID=A0A099D3A4_9ACTN|nr:MFS transporter [Actinopolyspora erythraea]ASU77593.1 MFS transporter [Actinopolyspora erythraea]KGI80411.1 fucose permease [Actinopolyspora erythraea]